MLCAGAVLTSVLAFGVPGADEFRVPTRLLGNSVLPRSCRLSEHEILELAVTDYDKRVQFAEGRLADGDEDLGTYEAIVSAYRFLPSGNARFRFLVVIVSEIESACTDCRNAIVATIDYGSGVVVQRARQNGSPIAASLSIRKGEKGSVGINFRILHVGCCGSGAEETWVVQGRP